MTIFHHHNIENGALFTTKEDVLDNTANETFSMLFKLKNYKNIDGKFHLKICYPENPDKDTQKCCNEWKQTSNPVSEGKITGFEPISLAYKKNCAGLAWQGLGKEKDFTHTLIDDTGEGEKWCMAVGAIQFEPPGKKTIPGPYNENTGKAMEVTHVKMLVRTGNVLFMLTLTSHVVRVWLVSPNFFALVKSGKYINTQHKSYKDLKKPIISVKPGLTFVNF